MKKFTSYNLVLKSLEVLPKDRYKEVIIHRFGLEDGKRKTLEAIGKKYGITRERVRQIEEAAFFILRKPPILTSLRPAFDTVDWYLNQRGKLAREERILNELTDTENPHPKKGAILFILYLGKPYHRFSNNNIFYTSWTNSKQIYYKISELINNLISHLENKRSPVPYDYIFNYLKNIHSSLSKKALESYLDAARIISCNNFGEFGLINWPEINPRGVRDKAYMILKKYNKPLHFTEVAYFINKENLSKKKVNIATVHNELIKDPRFVLVGRGIYALADWGYPHGTIREIIESLIKENGPMEKEKIIEEVLKKRLVKRNTILINLQDRRYFIRTPDGKYTLRE